MNIILELCSNSLEQNEFQQIYAINHIEAELDIYNYVWGPCERTSNRMGSEMYVTRMARTEFIYNI